MSEDKQNFQELRASYDGRHIGASLSTGEITVWKTDSLQKIARVRPGFSGGSQRYAIDPVNRLIFSGTWEEGLTCFDYEGEKALWHRDDLMGIQQVAISSAFPASLFVTLEADDYRVDEPGVITGIMEIEAETGRTTWTEEGFHELYVHPTAPVFVRADRYDEVVDVLDGQKRVIGSTPMANFAVMDVAFAKDMIGLAEGEKGIRTITFDGRLLAHYRPKGRQPNCIQAAFTNDQICVLDSWHASFITLLDPLSGNVISERQREYHGDICFIDDGSRFVDVTGKICRSSDGKFDAQLHE